jgi:hypothetical protein
VHTWAPKGETPTLQHHFNWSQLSVIAGITFRRFYFRLFPGACARKCLVNGKS